MKSIECEFQEIICNYKPAKRAADLPKISCSRNAFDYLKSIWGDTMEYKEQFVILLLNRASKVLGWAKISEGGISGTVADPKVIFQIALKGCASSIILSHNHPSGNVQPSENDILLTRKLKSAGEFLDLPVYDHLIINPVGFYSFADEGLMK
jgi:DNA repair protein RadC